MSESHETTGELTLEEKIAEFSQCLKESKRVIALVGAGLSAASGLPTFRGAGGLWRNYEATTLATPEAFDEDPGLVWEFYSMRRHMSLMAKPNRGHFALAELARVHPGFVVLSQNVDGLSPRANHPSDKIHFLHGNLFTVKCSNERCTYTEENYEDPIAPCLARASENGPAKKDDAQETRPVPNLDLDPTLPQNKPRSTESLPKIPSSELPHCPKCAHLLRPGVVWFGEDLPEDVLDKVKTWIRAAQIDLILVIGTSSTVQPAASYVRKCKGMWGARVAVVNLEPDERQVEDLEEDDWLFKGDSAVLLPEMFRGAIGEL